MSSNVIEDFLDTLRLGCPNIESINESLAVFGLSCSGSFRLRANPHLRAKRREGSPTLGVSARRGFKRMREAAQVL